MTMQSEQVSYTSWSVDQILEWLSESLKLKNIDSEKWREVDVNGKML